MRRPEKTTGVIRPRTLGLGRAASPEPTPPPPPPPPTPMFTENVKYRAMIALLLLLVFTWYSVRRESNAIETGNPKTTGEFSLRTEESDDVSGKGKVSADGDEDDGEGVDSTEKDEEEEGDGGEEKGGDSPGEEEEPVEADAPVEEEEEATPVVEKRSSSSSDGQKDRSKTVESYFKNFGGSVVEIDREGSYKYVLIKMEDSFGGKALLVRGCPHKEGTHCKHNDAFNRAKAELDMRGFKATVQGGGRITRHPSRHQKGQKEGYISIFGYSKTFGTCEDCNKLACTLIKAVLPDHGIKWANEGYSESDERKIPHDAWTRC